jgi:hypothetical protein
MIKLNHVYNLTVENFSFGSLSKEKLTRLFTDGRIASHFFELEVEQMFPELIYVNARGYDYVHKKTKKKYEKKCFTPAGLNFKPSNQKGQGRKFDKKIAHKLAKTLTYIICDIVDFPKIRIVFIDGKKLVAAYPRCIVTIKNREILFV